MNRRTDRRFLTDLVLGKLTPEESMRILKEIEQDPAASLDLEIRVELMNLVAESGAELFRDEGKTESEPVGRIARLIADIRAAFEPRRRAIPVLVVIGVLALIGGVRFVSTTVGSRFFALASVETSDFDSRVRGPGQNDITYASQLFTEGKIDESIQVLERYIRAYPQSEFIDYVHYAAGAVYLSGARRSILSLFPRYSKGQVDRGLVHLDAAIAGSSNPRIVEESLWLHAKGELMRDRPTNAAEDLGQIVKLGGPRQEDAARLLSQIQGLR